MLNLSTRQLVKATAPVLREHGETLTRHFYARMFEHNPELKQIFNQGHQRTGKQQQALAMAVTAYAEQIDDPSVLLPVLTMVANKHASLGIRAEHYPIVGKHLIASIGEVLGAAATPELVDAWQQAYGLLADTLIALETKCYQNMAEQDGGWSGWRGFVVTRKEIESAEITSFYLSPADGGHVPRYLPGQYVSLRLFVPELGYMQPRQYSLSCAPGAGHFRISVKRELEREGAPAGMVSNRLHDHVHLGMVVDLAPPTGDFFLLEEKDTPAVLISAGVGVTPMIAMTEHLLAHAPQRQVRFVHVCRQGAVHAFKRHINALAKLHSQLRHVVYYETPRGLDVKGQDYHEAGRIDLAQLGETALMPEADYYLCGPAQFMQEHKATLLSQGVKPQSIHLELFNTGGFAL